MQTVSVQPTRIRAAIVLSIALHLCAIGLLVQFRPTITPSAPKTDGTRVFAITTIVRRAAIAKEAVHTVPAHRAAVPIIARRPPPIVPLTRIAIRPVQRVLGHAPLASGVEPVRSIIRSPRPLDVAVAAPAPAATQSSLPVARPQPAESVAPSPSASVPAVATPLAGSFGGLFSENYPPALVSTSIVASIHSRLGEHGRIRVAVDESGHATDIRFVNPIPDEGVTQEIRAQLLGLTYVPADCNGLHCNGTFEINY